MKEFSDLQPISLINFVNEIISRLLHEKILKVISKLISPNQTRFVKGRSITKNNLLAQEIIRDIRIRNKSHNIVVKLNMTKTYDRVS